MLFRSHAGAAAAAVSTPPTLVAPTRPTVDDVAALIRARTKDDAGNEVGTFNGSTRPTDLQVEALIILAEGDVLMQTGTALYQATADAATSMIALRAACFVELSYWPEQVRTNRSPYDQLWRMYEAGMQSLIAGIEAGAGSPEGAGAADRFRYGTVPIVAPTRLPEIDFGPDYQPGVVVPS